MAAVVVAANLFAQDHLSVQVYYSLIQLYHSTVSSKSTVQIMAAVVVAAVHLLNHCTINTVA